MPDFPLFSTHLTLLIFFLFVLLFLFCPVLFPVAVAALLNPCNTHSLYLRRREGKGHREKPVPVNSSFRMTVWRRAKRMGGQFSMFLHLHIEHTHSRPAFNSNYPGPLLILQATQLSYSPSNERPPSHSGPTRRVRDAEVLRGHVAHVAGTRRSGDMMSQPLRKAR